MNMASFGGSEKLYRAIELVDDFTLTMHNIINKYDEVVERRFYNA